jgi:hypothetical protein
MADPRAENALRLALASIDELEARWVAARDYLKIDASRVRHALLGELAADPNLWDEQDHAREVTTELGRLNNDLESFDALRRSLDDAVVLAEFAAESLSTGEADQSTFAELASAVEDLGHTIAALETQSLFSGQYDENDAIVELHAGAGGTDAQDWTEMLLRMYSRWAERRGFGVEIDEATEGQEAGLLSSTFIVKGRFAYGWLSVERGVHRLVRISPFDSQARRQTSFASLDVTPLLDDRDRREGTTRGHLSFLGRRWSARQQDRLGDSHHPLAQRHRGELSERAVPTPEPSARHADPRSQAGRARSRTAPSRDGRAQRSAQR